MSKANEEALTWLYRSVIGLLVSVTFFFVKSNYDDFQTMKAEVATQKGKHAVIELREQDFDRRLTKLENSAK